ncbi:MAG: hypothetical protein EWM47_02410 [Anaerolineaceae bacterium]|nr:MAG: hypothetical protein EWM47_02410 [Anaerolineaceae bacterium]
MIKNKSFYIVTMAIGVTLIVLSVFLRGEELKVFSGLSIGIGAGLLGMSIVHLIMKRYEEKNPELARQINIDTIDERNIIIQNRAKAKAGDITMWLIILIAIITIIIRAPLWFTLLVIAIFLLYNIFIVYFMNKYQKEI